jgi:toxin secretion/phage lysis holin
MQSVLEYLAGFLRQILGDVVVKAMVSLSGGVFLGWVGALGGAMNALVWLMCMDFVLGFARGWVAKRISGAKLKYGFMKFLLYFAAIIAAHNVDEALNAKFAPIVHMDFTGFLILYLVLCEALSIFRHLHCFGVPIPKQLVNRLESLRDCELMPAKAKAERR